MRLLPLLCAVATTALLVTAAPAQQTAPNASPSDEASSGGPAKPTKPKKICRAGTPPDTGSRVPSEGRVCKTKEQWEKFDQRNRP